MSLFDFLSSILQPIVDLVDDLHTSNEERAKLRNELYAMQSALSIKMLDYETQLVRSQGSVIRAEATGHSWLQRNWRPIVMILFAYIIAHNYILSPVLGLESLPVPPDLWSLMKIGLGGYVAGRSLEKIVPQIVDRSRR